MDGPFWTMISALGQWAGPLGAVAVGVFAIRHDRKKERETKRREEIVRFLVTAYEDLESAAHREPFPGAQVERAVAKVQLFGSVQQADLARAFATEFATTGTGDLDALLEALKADLRSELGLRRDDSRTIYFRWVHSLGENRRAHELSPARKHEDSYGPGNNNSTQVRPNQSKLTPDVDAVLLCDPPGSPANPQLTATD